MEITSWATAQNSTTHQLKDYDLKKKHCTPEELHHTILKSIIIKFSQPWVPKAFSCQPHFTDQNLTQLLTPSIIRMKFSVNPVHGSNKILKCNNM